MQAQDKLTWISQTKAVLCAFSAMPAVLTKQEKPDPRVQNLVSCGRHHTRETWPALLSFTM
jgi:hypothetical protein